MKPRRPMRAKPKRTLDEYFRNLRSYLRVRDGLALAGRPEKWRPSKR